MLSQDPFVTPDRPPRTTSGYATNAPRSHPSPHAAYKPTQAAIRPPPYAAYDLSQTPTSLPRDTYPAAPRAVTEYSRFSSRASPSPARIFRRGQNNGHSRGVVDGRPYGSPDSLTRSPYAGSLPMQRSIELESAQPARIMNRIERPIESVHATPRISNTNRSRRDSDLQEDSLSVFGIDEEIDNAASYARVSFSKAQR